MCRPNMNLLSARKTTMTKKYQLLVFALVMTVLGSQAQPNTVMESLRIYSSIHLRSATTRLLIVSRNTAGIAQPVNFSVAMPKDAFIVDFSMTTGGVIYDGEIKERTVTSPGAGTGGGSSQIKTSRDSNKFGISLNVAAGDTVTFMLTYTEMLKRKHGVYDHQIYLSPGQPVGDLFVQVFIQENTVLTKVKVPAIRSFTFTPSETVEQNNVIARIEQTSPTTAHVLFVPSLEQQGPAGINGIFTVQYDVYRGRFGDIVVENGYFTHFFAASNSKPLPKDIVFVLDVSGSMFGHKMQQMIDAMLEILSDLRPDDNFNIVTFSWGASVWTSNLVPADGRYITRAKGFIRKLEASGGTNIYSGITRARSIFSSRAGSERLQMIFFLTDGQDAAVIADYPSIAIYGLAFGDDADLEYIKSLSARNGGFYRKIYTDKDAATQVENFYNEISTVPFKDVTFVYEPDVVDEHSLTQTHFASIFEGSEIIVSGRVKANATHFGAKINLVGQEGQKQLKSEVKDVKELAPNVTSIPANITNSTSYLQPLSMEKTWAVLTIDQKLKEEEKRATTTGDTKNLEQILDLSLKYNLGSPVTSVVVNDPQKGVQLVESAVDNEEKTSDDSRAISFIKSRPPTTTVRTTTTTTTTTTTPKPWCRPRQSVNEAIKSTFLAPTNVSSLVEVCMGARTNSFRYFRKAIAELQQMTTVEKAAFCDSSNTKKKGKYIPKQQRLLRNKSVGPQNPTAHRIYLTSMTITDGERSACVDPGHSLEKDTTYTLVASSPGSSLHLHTGWNKQLGLVTPHRLVFNSSDGHFASVFFGTSSMWRVTGDATFTFVITDVNSMSIEVENINVTLKRSASSLAINYAIDVSVAKTDAGLYTGMLADRLKPLAKTNKFPPKVNTDSRGKQCPALGHGPRETKVYKTAAAHAFLAFYLDVVLDLKKNLPIHLYA